MLTQDETRFRHRDLNWLSFNERVLQEAEDHANPLYERIKFLAIFSLNLDEYFRVRVSQLRQIKRVEKSIRKKLALRPNKITKEILEKVKLQQHRFGTIYYEQIIPELANNEIELVDSEQLSAKQKSFNQKFFKKKIAASINTEKVNFSEEGVLFLENNQLYFTITFENGSLLGVVNLPVDPCGRFING